MSAPEHEPGVPWVDDDGVRHFICAACGCQYISDSRRSDADREAEQLVNEGAVDRDRRRSVCDDCYPVILERARAAGLI